MGRKSTWGCVVLAAVTVAALALTSFVQARPQTSTSYFAAAKKPKCKRGYHAVRKHRRWRCARNRKRRVAAPAPPPPSPPVPPPAPPPSPPAPPAPPSLPVAASYEFGSEVSQADRSWPPDVVGYGGATLEGMTGVTIQPFRVFVYANPDALATAFAQWTHLDSSAIAAKAAQYRSGNVAAEAGSHGVFLNLYQADWSHYGLLDRQKIVAHEMFHLVQEQLENDPSNCGSTPFDQVRACGPTWLIEGSAETMGYRVAAARGLIDLADVETGLRQRVRGTSLTLTSLETYAGQSQPGAWDTMHLAAVHLAEIAPRGVQSFVDFWTAIGAGTQWPQAFQNAFGMTVAQYYAAFDAFRASL